jgi:flavin-dependent dehydrogenase
MSNTRSIDLLISGAGPAGLSTALHLLLQDPAWKDRLVILEKETLPRPKLCGGGVTRPGLQVLKDLNFPLPLPIPQARVDNVDLKYRDRTIRVRGEPMFIVFDRAEFDHYLAQQAGLRGICIQENEEALSFSTQEDHILVCSSQGEYRARMIVGADGSRGAVSQAIKGARAPKRISRTLEIWSPAAPDSPQFSQQSALFDFDFLSMDLQGYYWEFPTKVKGSPAHNRGVYDSRLVPGRPRANLPQVLEKAWHPAHPQEMPAQVKGAPIHWFDPANRIAAQRAILVGDAAGVEVLFGEGISPALMYGKIAANQISKAFHRQDFRFSTYQQAVLASKLGRYLLIRRMVAAYLYHLGDHPFFPHILWTVGQILARIWRGKRLY